MERVKYGLLGTANIAKRATIAGMLETTNSVFYAVAGRNKDKVDEFVKNYSFEKGYYSYDDLLNDPNVDVVYIALPNSMHAEWAIKAMIKGKHVLCEKPIACTPKEVERMFAASKENKVLIMEAFAYLHSPLIKRIKEIIDSGEIGQAVMMESSFFTLEHPKTNVRMQRELFGGAMFDLGCYPTSLALEIFDGEMPCEVKASAHFTEDLIDDINIAYMYYPSGRKVIITCGMCSPKRFDYFNIYCEKGQIEVSLPYNAKGDLTFSVDSNRVRRKEYIFAKDNYGLEIEQFSNCVLKKEIPHVTEELSLKNAKILDDILHSCGYFN